MPSIRILHEYYSGIWRGLSFRPSSKTILAIRENNIQLKHSDEGVFVNVGESIGDCVIPLRFFVYPMDYEYVNFTELPPRGFVFYYRGCSGQELNIVPEQIALAEFPEIPGYAPPCCVLDLDFSSAGYDYTLEIKARRLRWKYVLSTSEKLDLELIDVSGSETPIRISRNQEPGFDDAQCWITSKEYALNANPCQRFQLRESKSGKVIVKRLPCANGKMLAKETLSDGSEIPVAEVYINP